MARTTPTTTDFDWLQFVHALVSTCMHPKGVEARPPRVSRKGQAARHVTRASDVERQTDTFRVQYTREVGRKRTDRLTIARGVTRRADRTGTRTLTRPERPANRGHTLLVLTSPQRQSALPNISLIDHHLEARLADPTHASHIGAQHTRFRPRPSRDHVLPSVPAISGTKRNLQQTRDPSLRQKHGGIYAGAMKTLYFTPTGDAVCLHMASHTYTVEPPPAHRARKQEPPPEAPRKMLARWSLLRKGHRVARYGGTRARRPRRYGAPGWYTAKIFEPLVENHDQHVVFTIPTTRYSRIYLCPAHSKTQLANASGGRPPPRPTHRPAPRVTPRPREPQALEEVPHSTRTRRTKPKSAD